ncbi:MAG TPA: contractile injection system protein, VgrG/Pvc8 family [Coxiellaceae bacterium]|nr:contractile injection system protein, VgrG/Pvc8 family [Coxiellaceae bacterium]
MNNVIFSLKLLIENQELRVSELSIYETLSCNFYMKLQLLLEKPWNDPGLLVGKITSLKITINENQRYWNGFIYRVKSSLFPNQEGFYELKLILSSWLSLFNESCEYQIFENKTALEIMQVLFKDYSFCQFDSTKLTKQLMPIKYCVQYQESRYQFIRRLLVDQHIYFYFTHSENNHRLVLLDQPALALEELDENLFWQWHEHFSLANQTNYSSANSAHLGLHAGIRFNCAQQNYHITQITHYAYDKSHTNQSTRITDLTQSYYNHWHAQKGSSLPKRYIRSKFKMTTIQTAQITDLTPGGVKLAYRWNSQPTQHEAPLLHVLADTKQQMQFAPQIGTEVLVGYQNGDMEEPLVLAACYNVEHPTPFQAQSENWHCGFKAITSTGQSAMIFNNTPGTEELVLQAARGLQQQIGLKQSSIIQGGYQHHSISAQLEGKRIVIKACQISLQAGSSLIKLSPREILIQGNHIRLN